MCKWKHDFFTRYSHSCIKSFIEYQMGRLSVSFYSFHHARKLNWWEPPISRNSIKYWSTILIYLDTLSFVPFNGTEYELQNCLIFYTAFISPCNLYNVDCSVISISYRLWPDYASAHNNLGALSKDLNLAENAFRNAIEANPQHNGAHFNLGVIYM